MADMDSVLQIEMFGHGRGVGRIMVHVMPVADLRRAAVAATGRGDNAVSLREEEQHLRVPVVCAEGPTVMKHDSLGVPRPPILVKDLRSVFRRDIIFHRSVSCASGA